MSTQLGTNAARTLFDDYVKHAYQSMGPDLRDCVTFRATSGVETYKFRTMGRGLAQARGASQSLINEMGIAHSTVTCTLEDWIASQPTDIFDQAKTSSPQEIQALAKVIAGALKRRETQLVVDKLDAAAMATNHTISDGNTGLTVAKLTEARKLLKANDINEPVTLLFTENQEADVLSLNQFTSSDYAASSGATTGDIRQGHFGYRYKLIGSGRDEDGLAVDGSDIRDCYAFVPSAVGLAVGLMRTEVNYESDKVSWRSTGILQAGACVIDTLGIVKIQCDETPD